MGDADDKVDLQMESQIAEIAEVDGDAGKESSRVRAPRMTERRKRMQMTSGMWKSLWRNTPKRAPRLSHMRGRMPNITGAQSRVFQEHADKYKFVEVVKEPPHISGRMEDLKKVSRMERNEDEEDEDSEEHADDDGHVNIGKQQGD